VTISVALTLNGAPTNGGENGPLELVSPWIGYRVLKKNIYTFLPKNLTRSITLHRHYFHIFLAKPSQNELF